MKALLIAMRDVVKTWWHYRNTVGNYGAFFCVWLTPKQTDSIILLSKMLQIKPSEVFELALKILCTAIPNALETQIANCPQD